MSWTPPDPDAPLRIAYLTYRGKPHVGGQGVYSRHLTKALVDLGHHVEVYAGPPYDVPFRNYSRHGFPWAEQERLAHWLAGHDGPVALSNQATERVVELYGDLGFRLRFLEAPRAISCTGDRRPAREVLALRNV